MADRDAFDTSVSRRTALGTIAALSVAGGALPAIAAIAEPGDPRLRVFEGRYAIDGQKVVDGYFVALKDRIRMDVVVVVPAGRGTAARVRAEARRRALAGAYAIALPAGAQVSKGELADTMARLRNFAMGNGNVTLVTV